jgi:hypothetical protein
MHMTFNGQEHMHISIDWLYDLQAQSFNIHRCLHCSELEMLVSFYR